MVSKIQVKLKINIIQFCNFGLIYWPHLNYSTSVVFYIMNLFILYVEPEYWISKSFVDYWSTASTAVIWRTLRRHWMSWLPHGKMSSVKWRYALNIFKVSVPYWCFRYAVLYISTSSQQFEIHFVERSLTKAAYIWWKHIKTVILWNIITI